MLNTFVSGEAGAPRLLIAHGLFGSARNWNAVARRLSERFQVITVDMRNHASSDWQDTHSYADLATDLDEVLRHHGPCHLMGHSMGGKAAMVLALNNPERLQSLIVADIAPVTYSHSQMPVLEAMRGVDLSQIEARRDANAALARTLDDPGLRAFLTQSLDVKAKRWRLNLEVLADQMPLIMGFPEVSGSYEGPTLFLSGATSDYVLPEHRPQIKTLFPAARFAKIPEAGHWLHAENPKAFEAAVATWIEAQEKE